MLLLYYYDYITFYIRIRNTKYVIDICFYAKSMLKYTDSLYLEKI